MYEFGMKSMNTELEILYENTGAYAHLIAHSLVAILDEALYIFDDRFDLQHGRPEQAEDFAEQLQTRLDQLGQLAPQCSHQLLLHHLVPLELHE